MYRKQLNNTSYRRRQSYTPIMLVSKSLKPADRSVKQQQRKFSTFKPTEQKELDILFAASLLRKHQFSKNLPKNVKEKIVKQLTEQLQSIMKNQEDEDPSNKMQNQFSENTMRLSKNKVSTTINPVTSIIQMQFCEKNASNQRKNHYRRLEKMKRLEQSTPSIKQQIEQRTFKKFLYYTNSKNLTQQLKHKPHLNIPKKIGDEQIEVSLNSEQMKNNTSLQSNWNNILFNHYIKIKAVSPKIQNKSELDQITPQKAELIMRKVQSVLDRNSKKYNNINSYFPKKNEGILETNSPQTQVFKNYINSDIIEAQSTLKKIQDDINFMIKRPFCARKQYFVFGLSENSRGMSNENILKLKLDVYRDFLFKINYSNGIYVRSHEEIDKPYKFCVGGGNNSMLVKGIMRRRYWWQVNEYQTKEQSNFLWTQLKVQQFIELQKNGNKKQNAIYKARKGRNSKIIDDHHEINPFLKSRNHSAIQAHHIKGPKISYESNKQRQLEKISSMIEINSHTSDPHFQTQETRGQNNEKILKGQDLQIWKSHYKKHKKIQDKGSENVYLKRFNTMLRRKQMRFINHPSKIKIHNHFECNYYLGNKKALFYYMKRYYQANEIDPFTKIPLTFHVAKGIDDNQYQNFLNYYQQLDKIKRQQRGDPNGFKNIWIIKPGQYTNRGKGITVCGVLDDVKIRLKGRQKNPSGKPRTFILQKYIQKPLLYNNRKFDIRHYMLMTCFNGKFKGYWYEQGYLRTTSFEYSIKNTNDLYIHLTNDAVQKNSQDYGKFQKGNKVSYNEFQRYMQGLGKNGKKKKYVTEKQKNQYQNYNFYVDTLPKMRQLAIDSMRATYKSLSPNRKEQSFELFGLDFMLDQNLNVYLIEVNTNPCLQTSCPLLANLISRLIQNVFKICVDPFFPPPLDWPISKRFQMGQNALEQNKFQLVFDENTEGKHIQQLLQKKQLGNMGEVAQDEDLYEDEGKEWNEDD